MKQAVSVCIVGAGSSYTPELVEGLLQQDQALLPVRELRLTDINAERLAIMAGFTERAVRHANREVRVASDTRLAPMLEGADFVITQIRVGGMKARHLDESIPLKYGIIGQETTGPGGMFKALRTIPPMIEIGQTVAAVAPNAFILNYANPSGIVAEAVSKHTRARIIGLCSGIPSMIEHLSERFSSRYPDLHVYTVGLNHFGHIHRVLSGDRDVTAQIMAALADEQERRMRERGVADPRSIIRLLGAYPIGYVGYFYHRGRMVAEAKAKPKTRAQEIESIEQEILAEAARTETVTKPEALARRGGGGYAGITFAVMKAVLNDTGEELTANVPSRGCVDGVEDDAVVEIVCRMDRDGAHPLPVGPIPIAFRGVMLALKAYETLTVAAAVKRDKRLATLALLNHPLCGDLDVIEPMLDEMLAAHGLQFG
jgi:6-phospho-beta-glucosidase